MIEYKVKVDANGDRKWYLNGKRHREDGPAIERINGDKIWYLNDECHREDGPAIEWANGSRYWYRNGKRHREDGPAIERINGDKIWYLNGQRLTKAEFNARMNPAIEMTVAELADKLGIKNLKIVK